ALKRVIFLSCLKSPRNQALVSFADENPLMPSSKIEIIGKSWGAQFIFCGEKNKKPILFAHKAETNCLYFSIHTEPPWGGVINKYTEYSGSTYCFSMSQFAD